MQKILLLLSFTCLISCSSDAWYKSAQSAQTTHCMKAPLAEYEDCIKQTQESYNEYEKKREELKTPSDPTR